MSKSKGTSKAQWASVDRRIRDRRGACNAGDQKELEAQLARLPDVAEQADIIDVVQPAVGRRETQAEAQGDAGSADADGDAAADDGGAD